MPTWTEEERMQGLQKGAQVTERMPTRAAEASMRGLRRQLGMRDIYEIFDSM